MVRNTEDFRVLEGKKVYIYGAKKIAQRVYPILRDKGYNVQAFLVSVPENNANALFGLPVKWVNDVIEDAEDAYVVVAVNTQFRKEIVDNLLKLNFYHILMIHDSYLHIIRDHTNPEVIDYFEPYDYSVFYSDEVEFEHVILTNLADPQRFKCRVQSGWWFQMFMQHADKNDLYSNNLAERFERSWGAYHEVSHKAGTKQSDKKIQERCNMFAVRCHVDKPCDVDAIPAYITQIQAGAALTTKNVCTIKDNKGQDNISNRNRDFSECSAYYWIWKNQEKKEYTGVGHYRRHLAASSAALLEAMDQGVDVVNTIPTVMYPSIEYFFKYNFFYERDYELIIEAISKMHPEYMPAFYKLGKDNIYLANNICVMKTEWFDRMCQFVFDVLLYIDDYYYEKGFVREDRYAGYIYEYLYSVFILHHAKELNIAYTNMKFLQ